MEIITGTEEFHIEADTAVAIGKFDGVHLGHRRILEEILNKQSEGLRSCVFTFDRRNSRILQNFLMWWSVTVVAKWFT